MGYDGNNYRAWQPESDHGSYPQRQEYSTRPPYVSTGHPYCCVKNESTDTKWTAVLMPRVTAQDEKLQERCADLIIWTHAQICAEIASTTVDTCSDHLEGRDLFEKEDTFNEELN